MKNPFEDAESNPFIPKKYQCTIVSLLPWEPAPEEKPHLLPSVFIIPKANPKTGIGVSHVGEAIYYVPNPFDERSTKVSTSPNEVARSVVEDYVSGQMCLGDNCCPGLFWLEGELTEADVLKHFSNKVAEYKEKQINWFKALVNLADADFTKNRNRMAISDIQIHAAKYIGYNADWVDFNSQLIEMAKCKFCQSPISIEAIKCPVCNEVVNPEAYKKLREQVGV